MDNSSAGDSSRASTELWLDVDGSIVHVAAPESTNSVDPGRTSVRKRLSRACDRCRERKVKCDLRRPTCANCEIRSFKCEFFLQSQKRGRKRRVTGPANENIHISNIERREHSPAASSTRSFPASCGVDTPNVLHPQIDQTSYGTSPISVENDVLRDSQIKRIICDLEILINKEDRSETLTSAAAKCVKAFFDGLYPLMPIVCRPDIEAAIAHIDSHYSQKEVSLFALLTALCAVTIAVLPNPIFSVKAEIGVHFYHASKAALDIYAAEDLEHPNSISIIIRYLYAEYHHTTGRMRTSWHNLGAAIRICQGLRLHDESSYAHMKHPESELCRRIFFLLFVGDKSASILSKHPVVMGKFSLDGGITVKYPHNSGDVDSLTFSEFDHEGGRPDSLTGFMFNYELWNSAYVLLLEVELLREQFLSRPNFESPQQLATLADFSRLTKLYLEFQTSLDNLPSGLQAHPTFSISTSSFGFQERVVVNQASKILAIQRANLHISFQCLRMVVLQAMPALADSMSQLWSGIDQSSASEVKINPTIFESAKEVQLRAGESSALLLQKINIAETMLHIVCSCELDDLRINGEACVAKIRLIGATMLELIDSHVNSPLVGTARKFRDSYPRILAHLDSKLSDSVQ